MVAFLTGRLARSAFVVSAAALLSLSVVPLGVTDAMAVGAHAVKPRLGGVHVMPGTGSPFGVACSTGSSPKTSNCDLVTQNFTTASDQLSIVHDGKPEAPTSPVPGGIAVACPSSTTCVLAGASRAGGTLEWLVNGRPAGVTTVTGSSALDGVACESVTMCVGVGYRNGKSTGTAVQQFGEAAVVKQGQQTVKAHEVKGVLQLKAAACATATRCYLVGTTGDGRTGKGVVVKVKGTTVGTRKLVKGTGSLAAISCGAATTCEAAGNLYSKRSGVVGLVDRIVDGAGKRPVKALASGAVSCPTAKLCITTGLKIAANNSSEGLVAAVIDGKPRPPVVTHSLVTTEGVSCPTPTACLVVGTTSANRAAAQIATL